MSRLKQFPLKWLAAGAAVVLVVVGVTFLLSRGSGHRTSDTLLSTDAPTDPAVPTETAVAVPTASPTLARTPSDVPTVTTPSSPDPTATGLPTRCQGPLQPGEPADASCDAMDPHPGLPHPCIDPYHGCGWPDAHGATPGGPYSASATADGNDVHVTWSTNEQDLQGNSVSGPVHEFVVRLLPNGSDTVLLTRELPTSTFSTTLLNLDPGPYDVVVQELNDSGLSAGFDLKITVDRPPTPTPTPTPAPSTTPTPTETPSPTSS